MKRLVHGALLGAALAGAWAFGCSDDATVAAPVSPVSDAAPAPDVAPPPPVDASPTDPCTPEADGVPVRLSCTGLYADIGAKAVAADVAPYKPAYEFWSDGAEKSRFLRLPPNTTIDIARFDEWRFPNGTKVWKEFKLGGKRIETRYYVKLDDGTWSHTSFRWDADASDAVRKDTAQKVPGIGPDGGTYEIPSSGQCDQCHRGRVDELLGLDAVSLGLPGATGQTLAVLAATGKLSAAPPRTTLALPGTAAAQAAVGWVNINCGPCHNANTSAAASSRAHFLVRATDLAPPDGGVPAVTRLDVYTQGYCGNTSRSSPDGGLYKYLAGQEPQGSLMSVLARTRVPADQPITTAQMPPIATRAVDRDGVAALDAWILTLPRCP